MVVNKNSDEQEQEFDDKGGEREKNNNSTIKVGRGSGRTGTKQRERDRRINAPENIRLLPASGKTRVRSCSKISSPAGDALYGAGYSSRRACGSGASSRTEEAEGAREMSFARHRIRRVR